MGILMRTPYQLLFLCLLGSIFRLAYGIIYTPWEQAPDHLAWEILIQNSEFSYQNLIYYPHEGGTFFISIFSRFVALFTSFNSLVITAFILDFVARLVQLFVTRKVFGKQLMLIYGVWTIFALPIMIPWGTLNFGLHSIASLFPFILLYFLWLNKSDKQHYIKIGLFLALALWFSYSNIVLIIAFLIFQFFYKKPFKQCAYALLSFAAVMLIHVLVRTYADPGFHLINYDLSSIRGTEFSLSNPDIWTRLYKVWIDPLMDSSVAILNSEYTIDSLKYIWITLIFVGIISCIRALYKGVFAQAKLIGLLVVFLFLSVYALSPFYYESSTLGPFILYRHLTYILPLLALMTLAGLSLIKFKMIWMVLFLGIGMYSSSILFFQETSSNTADKAAGWALTFKLGHQPEVLYKIMMASDRDKTDLVQGIGWGISAALFSGKKIGDPAVREEKITQLIALIDQYPSEAYENIVTGISFAFAEGVTPVLDHTIFDEISVRINAPSAQE